MTESIAFDASIPEDYDQYLGPVLFDFAARDFAERVRDQVLAVGEVLEVACGTGISTQHLRRVLPEAVAIRATDLSPEMIAFAEGKRGALPGVEFLVADATDLPYGDGRFDAVLCEFGIMFFPDKAVALTEMVRVLKPAGALTLNVWDSVEKNQIIAVAQEAIANHFESDPPRFLEVPFGFHDAEHISTLMRNAGLTGIKSTIVSKTIDNVDAHDIAYGLVNGNPTITRINEDPDVDAMVVVDSVASAAIAHFGSSNLSVDLQEIVLSGTKV